MTKLYHVKKGDKVLVNAGKFKGEEATIAAVLTKNDRVVLEFANLSEAKAGSIGMRTVKKSQANPNGGRVARSVSVHVSNVNPVAADKTEVK
ncbi:50S ribosomal protein L24 [bioreactor metagenome]|uniref:50S ribosomal protein L24 n=1 Tax=bioreactor metagenome TaxID=1076179 RepID=A0A645DM40_9ZZZZ